MPTLSRLYLRTALLYLALGGLLGGLLLWNKGLTFAPALPIWLPVHVALMTWGWLWNLALGAAFWILPRFGRSRPHTWLAWLAYVCLNASLLATALMPLVHGPWPSATAGLLQLIAALAFAVHTWPRVKLAER
jgi:hypothetical protein